LIVSNDAKAKTPSTEATLLDVASFDLPKSVGELRADGKAAAERRDPDSAERTYRALLKIDPTDIYALVGLGLVSRLRGQRDQAMRRFQEAAQACPSHPWPLLEISAEHSADGSLDEAEATLRRALLLSPDHYYVLMALGRVLRNRGALEEAQAVFRSATRLHPMQASSHVELASELARIGRLEEAIATLDVGAGAGASKEVIYRAKARLLREDGQRDRALAALQAALSDNPADSALKLEIASELFALGRNAEEIQAWQAIIDDEKIAIAHRRDAAMAAGRAARDQKNTALAIRYFEQATTFDNGHVESYRELATQFRVAHRFREAQQIYRKVLSVAPESLGALGGLAIVSREMGDHHEALELLQQAKRIDPKNDWIHYEFGVSLREMGHVQEAGTIWESIVPSSNMYPAAQMALGMVARTVGSHLQAVECFERAANTADDPTNALCDLASEQRSLGDFVAAKSAIARIFDRNAQSFHGHMADGYLARAMNDRAGARVAFRRAAAIMPKEAQPLVEIATEEKELGNPSGAEAAVEAALQLDPRHEAALLEKGARLTESGDIDSALALYAKLRDDRLGSVWSYLAAAQLLVERGDGEAALALLAEARKYCAKSSQIDLREAAILRGQGFLDAAFELLSSTHSRYPHELWPWFSRASLAIDLGYFDIAETMLTAPPPVAGQDKARIVAIRAQLDKARWDLDAAMESFGEAISLEARPSQATYERAKLRLITFDLAGARADLLDHAKLRSVARRGQSTNASQTHIGQLYEEFALECKLSLELATLRGRPPAEQVPLLMDLVRHFPESTAAAIGLMIALRRAGRFDRRPKSLRAAARIPEIITQYWNDPDPPPEVRGLMHSWALSDPAFKIEVFDDAQAYAYLGKHCDAAVARAFTQAKEPAQRADVFRLARLFIEGGYFIDADDRARAGLAACAPRDADLFVHQEDLGSIGSNVMGSVPGHPVIGAALQDSVDAITRGDMDIIWLSTGPGMLTRALARWVAAHSTMAEVDLEAVAIFTLAEIRKAAAIHCYVAYKTTKRAWLNKAFARRARIRED
jgi:tetratricopeptide (TPR) repeat protein